MTGSTFFAGAIQRIEIDPVNAVLVGLLFIGGPILVAYCIYALHKNKRGQK